jgi:hypothetical protein
VDAELDDVRERLRTDTPFWAEHCATILTKDKRKVRLKAFPWQARTPQTPAGVTPLDEALERQRAAGMPMRAIILKARQLGFSTWVQAKLMQRVTQMPDQYALVAAHKGRAASNMMDMANRIYDYLPTDRQLGEMLYGADRMAPFSIKPQKIGEGQTRSGRRWMSLGERARRSEESVYETMTAGAKGDGRASTPSMFHGSEVAHYEDPNFLGGVLNAVPKLAETIVVLESTANGFNHFYDRWVSAQEGAEDPETGGTYAPLFYPWHANPYNTIPFISDQARDRFEKTVGDQDGGGDEEEELLVDVFGCTLEQLRWRRVTIAEECGGDLEMFHQEHPATPEQAFIGSGRPVFPGILVARAVAAAEKAPAPVEGVLRGADWKERKTRSGTVLIPRRAVWVPETAMTPEDEARWPLGARLLVWEHPLNALTQAGLALDKRKPDGQYVEFVDVAEGGRGEGEDPDYSVIQVIDHITRLQVARYRSRVPIHELPLLALLVAVYFNEATLAVEKTGLGVGVVDALAKDYRFRRMYRTRRPGDDQRADAAGDRIGWETTGRTKPLMETTFGALLKTGDHGLRDPATARELTTYVEDPKNPAKHGAQKGTHDDLLMAAMGAQRVAAEMAPRNPDKTRRVSGRDVDDPVTGY